MRAVQFRIALSIAVLGLLANLALGLIIVQNLTFHEAIRIAAAAQMDAVTAASQGQLKSQIETLSTLFAYSRTTHSCPTRTKEAKLAERLDYSKRRTGSTAGRQHLCRV